MGDWAENAGRAPGSMAKLTTVFDQVVIHEAKSLRLTLRLARRIVTSGKMPVPAEKDSKKAKRVARSRSGASLVRRRPFGDQRRGRACFTHRRGGAGEGRPAWEVPWQCSDSGDAKRNLGSDVGNDCRALLQDGSDGTSRGRRRRMAARGRVLWLDRGCGKGGYLALLSSVRGVCKPARCQRARSGMMGNGALSFEPH